MKFIYSAISINLCFFHKTFKLSRKISRENDLDGLKNDVAKFFKGISLKFNLHIFSCYKIFLQVTEKFPHPQKCRFLVKEKMGDANRLLFNSRSIMVQFHVVNAYKYIIMHSFLFMASCTVLIVLVVGVLRCVCYVNLFV